MPDIVKLWGLWVLLTLSIFFGVALIRHLLPKLWGFSTFLFVRDRVVKAYPDMQGFVVALWHAVQTWPSLAVGALVGAYQLGTSPGDAWKGVAFGLFAPLLHHLLKILKKPPVLTMLAMLTCLGCSSTPEAKVPILTTRQGIEITQNLCRAYQAFPTLVPRDEVADELCPLLLAQTKPAPAAAPPPPELMPLEPAPEVVPDPAPATTVPEAPATPQS